MTRIGRFVALVGSITIAFIVTIPCWVLLRALPGSWIVAVLVIPAVFGVTTGALYTWTVDGAFVRTRSK